MIVKLRNDNEKFYQYMGKFFGSRLVEGKKAVAFVSIQKNTIKNVYTTKQEYLEKLLDRIKRENKITNSIVTNTYRDLYERCGFLLDNNSSYKNFVTIYTEQKEDKKLATI